MKVKSILVLALGTLLLALPSCKKEVDQWANVEALIKQLKITNAGLSASETINGVVDNEAMTIVFNNVPAESPISAIKLDGKFSLGAKLDTTVYDFTVDNDPNGKVLTREVKISNYGDKHSTYKVTINLSDPASSPILEKLVMKDAAGNTYKSNIVVEDNVIFLGMEGLGEAELSEIVITPSRAIYTFSAMEDGKLSESNPGTLTLDFMGLTTVFTIDFTAGAAPGIDFASAKVHDFSAATGNCPDFMSGINCRGTDFDGEYVVFASRDDAAVPNPRYAKVSDLLADNFIPMSLSSKGMEGGTHVISAARLSHGHIYMCNLSTAGMDAEPLKVYHYASVTSDPELVLEWHGEIDADNSYTGRLGDNMSVNLDESGNGFAFFHKQEPGDKIYRFTVTGFTQFSEPYEIDLGDVFSYYGYVNECAENPGEYLFTSSYKPALRLINADGETLKEIEFDWTEGGAQPNHGVDPRSIVFNRGRYLMFTVSNSQNMHWNFGPVLYVMDITDGFNTMAALGKLEDRFYDEEVPWEPEYAYFLTNDFEVGTQSGAWTAQCNAAEVNGKLVVYSGAAAAGFALIEFEKAKR